MGGLANELQENRRDATAVITDRLNTVTTQKTIMQLVTGKHDVEINAHKRKVDASTKRLADRSSAASSSSTTQRGFVPDGGARPLKYQAGSTFASAGDADMGVGREDHGNQSVDPSCKPDLDVDMDLDSDAPHPRYPMSRIARTEMDVLSAELHAKKHSGGVSATAKDLFAYLKRSSRPSFQAQRSCT